MDSESEEVCAENLSQRKLEGLCETSDWHTPVSDSYGRITKKSTMFTAFCLHWQAAAEKSRISDFPQKFWPPPVNFSAPKKATVPRSQWALADSTDVGDEREMGSEVASRTSHTRPSQKYAR